MSTEIEYLAHEPTCLGTLCLRRRKTLSDPRQWVTEVTLNHQFLMSSLHTDSERALANLALEGLSGDGLRVLVGGLGLGYTAQAALECERVAHVEVVEFLPQVVQWMRDGLFPLAEQLNQQERFLVTDGDIYQRLLAPPSGPRFDAILIDVDHSPQDQLADGDNSFYEVAGLQLAGKHLREDGVIAMWSYDSHTPLLEAMRSAFEEASVHPISYYNQHVRETFTDWLYIARRPL